MSIGNFPAGIPLKTLVFAGVVAVMLTYMSTTFELQALNSAVCTANEWEQAATAFEQGENGFNGRCLSTGGGFLDEQQREFMIQMAKDEAVLARQQVDEFHAEFIDDIWAKAAAGVASPAMTIFAIVFASTAAGAVMETGTAAWSLSNGWHRRKWIATFLGLTAAVILAAFLVLVVVYMVVMAFRIQGLGLAFELGAPGLLAITAIPGVLFYGALAFVVGILLKSQILALLTVVAISVVDYAGGNFIGNRELIPSILQRAAVDDPSTRLTPWVAASILLGMAAALAAGIRWHFINRMDVPDRPQ